jgi:hypothetical protein
MSENPWVYQPPQPAMPGYDPAAHLLAPARRAGILAIILGSLVLLCGGAILLVAIGFDQLPAEMRSQMEGDLARYGSAGVSPRSIYMTAAVVILLIAIVMIVLGALVMRGGMGSIISLMIVTVLLIIFLILQLVSIPAIAQGDSRAMIGACMAVIPLVLLGLLMWFLAGAVRAAPQIWMIRMQQQSQMWQYQQNQQQYQHGNWPPPPPPPPSGGDPPVS